MKTKKFYRKIDIVFWFFIMFLPILIGLVNAIGFACNGWRLDNAISSNNYFNYIIEGFGKGIISFSGFLPNFIINTFGDLFDTIGLLGDNNQLIMISVIASWFVWVVYLHLLVDILAFIPKFFHNWLRKVDKYDE